MRAERGEERDVLPADSSDEKVRALQSLRLTAEALPPPREPGAVRRALPWALLALSAALNAFLIATWPAPGAGGPAASAEPRVEPPAPAPAEAAAAPGKLTAGAYLAIEELIPISASAEGRVRKVLVKLGDQVAAGQLVVALDDAELRAELELARAKQRDAQRTLDRVKALVKGQAATQAEEDRALGQAEIAAAEAELVARRLDRMRVLAPIAGTILEVGVKAGEVVQPDGKVLLKLADLATLTAEATVNEHDVASLSPGQEAEVRVDALPDKAFGGKVREIARHADRSRGTVLVKVSVLEPDPSLRPGMSARVIFR